MTETTTAATPEPAAEWPPLSELDGDAIFKSFVWFDLAVSRGEFEEYRGRHVAILGEQVIDADPDEDELRRRLLARHNVTPLNRVVIRHLEPPTTGRFRPGSGTSNAARRGGGFCPTTPRTSRRVASAPRRPTPRRQWATGRRARSRPGSGC